MRHYHGDGNIYIFGFSRGAYTARFLAEMLDYAGLLGPDNEEMIPFIWDAFSQWKLTRYEGTNKRQSATDFLKNCRETLCRPVTRVKFLGLFDTVNSIADFEINNDTMPTAGVIRHAVSIDERRVKFQPVLLDSGSKTDSAKGSKSAAYKERLDPVQTEPLVVPGLPRSVEDPQLRERHDGIGIHHPDTRKEEEDNMAQDVQEIWFPGGHADIGGGFQREADEEYQLSHSPLVWMVQEAQRAGIEFDQEKMYKYKCLEKWEQDPSASTHFHEALRQSSKEGILHDRIGFGEGVSPISVLAWRLMEYLPIRRSDMQPDGSWKLVHWPLHRGKARGIPSTALIHGSAIHRLQSNSDYRPANVIVGGGGRGKAEAPAEYGIGEWEILRYEGEPARETYIRKGCRDCH